MLVARAGAGAGGAGNRGLHEPAQMSDDFDYVAAKLARLERVFHPVKALKLRLSLLTVQSRRCLRRLRRRLFATARPQPFRSR